MTNAIDIATLFVKHANKSAENDLTNLKLQKILYLAQGHYLGNTHGSPLFEESVEAWPLGPVVREVYETFSVLGASPITLLDIPEDAKEVDESVVPYIDFIWKKYGKYSASYLVKLTHEQAPWKKTFDGGNGNRTIIPVDMMAGYFAPKSA